MNFNAGGDNSTHVYPAVPVSGLSPKLEQLPSYHMIQLFRGNKNGQTDREVDGQSYESGNESDDESNKGNSDDNGDESCNESKYTNGSNMSDTSFTSEAYAKKSVTEQLCSMYPLFSMYEMRVNADNSMASVFDVLKIVLQASDNYTLTLTTKYGKRNGFIMEGCITAGCTDEVLMAPFEQLNVMILGLNGPTAGKFREGNIDAWVKYLNTRDVGVVYIASNNYWIQRGVYKVGFTHDVHRRMQELSSSHDEDDFQVYAEYVSNTAYNLEQYLHKGLHDVKYKQKREYFAIDLPTLLQRTDEMVANFNKPAV